MIRAKGLKQLMISLSWAAKQPDFFVIKFYISYQSLKNIYII